jgi:hypothetical protein
MASHVSPSAPFMVIPSAMEALKGERKTDSFGVSRVISRRRSKPKALLAPMAATSAEVRLRGSSVMGTGGDGSPPGPRTESHAGRRATRKASPAAGRCGGRQGHVGTPFRRGGVARKAGTPSAGLPCSGGASALAGPTSDMGSYTGNERRDGFRTAGRSF